MSEPIPPELREEMEAAGIDPAILMGGGESSFDIFMGDVTAQDRVGERFRPPRPPGSRPGASPGGLGGAIGGQPPDTGLQYSTVGALLQRFYRLSPENLRRIQALLFAGGFFGQADVTDVRWGEHDENSFSAWAGLIQRTARFNAAGEDVTYSQVLDQAAEAAGIDPEILGDVLGDEADLEEYLAGAQEQGDFIQIMLSDPNGLRSTIDQVASSVLGRRANADEQRMFISFIHGIQRQGQTAIQRGQAGAQAAVQLGGDLSGQIDVAGELGYGDDMPTAGDTIVEYAAPDEAASAEALIREQNPEEAGAHDVALQVANLLELLNAPVNVPRLTV